MMWISCAHGGEKRAMESLGLELHVVVSHLVGDEN